MRLLRWVAMDNAEPPSPLFACPPDSPPYHLPQEGLLWNPRFVLTPPKSWWEPSCSEDEEVPVTEDFPFRVYPKIDPEDVRRSPSPIVSEYWDDHSDVFSDYNHNPNYVFPSPPLFVGGRPAASGGL